MDKSKLLKILALAENGAEGEKQAAERTLKSLLERYDMTMEELIEAKGGKRSIHYIDYHNSDYGKKLVSQIISFVFQQSDYMTHETRSKTKLPLHCTKAQAIEVQMLYDVYYRAYEAEQADLYTAFIHRHKIFNLNHKPAEDTEELSLEQQIKIQQLMRGMDQVDIHKQIEGK